MFSEGGPRKKKTGGVFLRPMSDHPKPVPRKDTYDPRFLPIVQSMCRLGATDKEVADALKIGLKTLAGWRVRHSEFASAMLVGKQEADERVISALYNRAVGASYVAYKMFVLTDVEYDKKGNKIATRQRVCKRPYIENIPADVTAAIFWLKNRQGWRNDGSAAQNQIDGPTTVLNVEAQLLARISGVFERHAGREIKCIEEGDSESK